MLGQIKLALDAAVLAGRTFLRNEVNTYIAYISLTGPIIPHPHVGKAVDVERIKLQVLKDQPLEAVAQIVLTWPLVLICLATSWPLIRSALPRGHPGIRHPQPAG